jgi:spermidine synthase
MLAVGCLGVSAFATQVTLMRELVSAFSGNELIFGIVLGTWMLLTGLGSALGGTLTRLKSPQAVFVPAQVLVALLPIGQVFLLRALRNVVFVRGAEVGLPDVVVTCCVLLAPYCLTLGYLLTLASWLLARSEGDSPIFVGRKSGQSPQGPTARPKGTVPFSSDENWDSPHEVAQSPQVAVAAIGRVYLLDSLGSVVGGLLFSLLLVYVLDHFGILLAAATLNLAAAGLVAVAGRRWLAAAGVAAVTAALAAVMATLDLDRLSTGLQYPGQQVVYRGHSPYGNLVVTRQAGQYNFVENGVPLFSTHNVERVEETVHYAMAQRPKARRVLLVSGGVSGTAGEILKYGVENVDYVELDPLVLEVARRLLPESLADPRIRVLTTDGRLYVKQTAERYDVVILDVPEPCTSQVNRFYTREFFAEVRRVLVPDGVLALSIGHYDEGYVDPEMSRVLASGYRTVKEAFEQVLFVPGQSKVYFLASQGPLTLDVAERMRQAGIVPRLVTPSYLAAMLAPGRLADLRRALAQAAPTNRDFSPILYYYHLRYWMSQFRLRFGLLEAALLVVLAVVLVVYLARIRPVSLAVFTAGLAASALEVVLLLGFEMLYGSVYYQVGLIVTMFMLGLVIGSAAASPRAPRHWLIALTLALSRRERGPGVRNSPDAASPLAPRPSPLALAWLLAALALYAACLPAALAGLGRLGNAFSPTACQVAIPLLALLLAALVGAAFPLAARLHRGSVAQTASRLYTADYVGAALGALLVSTILIPLVGVTAVCLGTALVALASGVLLVVTSK